MFTRPGDSTISKISAAHAFREPYSRRAAAIEEEMRTATADLRAALRADLDAAHAEYIAKQKAAYDRDRALRDPITRPFRERIKAVWDEYEHAKMQSPDV